MVQDSMTTRSGLYRLRTAFKYGRSVDIVQNSVSLVAVSNKQVTDWNLPRSIARIRDMVVYSFRGSEDAEPPANLIPLAKRGQQGHGLHGFSSLSLTQAHGVGRQIGSINERLL